MPKTTKTKEKTIVFDRQEIGFYSPDYPTVLAHEGFKEAMLAEGNVVLSVSSRVLLVTQGTIGYAGGTLKSRKKMQEQIDNNPPKGNSILIPKKITKNSNAKRK